jgi:signal transduction histidine kinase
MNRSSLEDWKFAFRDLALFGLLVLGLFVLNLLLIDYQRQVEHDIWELWVAKVTLDSQLTHFCDLFPSGAEDEREREKRENRSRRLLDDLCHLYEKEGQRMILHPIIKTLALKDGDRKFYVYTNPLYGQSQSEWSKQTIRVTETKPWALEVEYRFAPPIELGSLRNIQVLRDYSKKSYVLVLLLLVTCAVAMVARYRNRVQKARLQQIQQVALDLGYQMCHELRNGLWTFSLEARNLHRLFQLVEEYFSSYPALLEQGLRRVGIAAPLRERLRRDLDDTLADRNLDPETDILPCNVMVREAHQQIDNFSSYLRLTVEELDWNLLGARGQWQLVAIRLGDVWREASELLSVRLKAAGVSQKCQETGEDWVVADRRALLHVFVNLAKNALEAMQGQAGPRELRFEAQADGNQVRCRVCNSGPPIRADHLPLLFRRNFSTKGAGRGRGLTLVHDSVQQMNGAIGVTSDAASGTCFLLTFPRAPAPTEKRELTKDTPQHPPSG